LAALADVLQVNWRRLPVTLCILDCAPACCGRAWRTKSTHIFDRARLPAHGRFGKIGVSDLVALRQIAKPVAAETNTGGVNQSKVEQRTWLSSHRRLLKPRDAGVGVLNDAEAGDVHHAEYVDGFGIVRVLRGAANEIDGFYRRQISGFIEAEIAL